MFEKINGWDLIPGEFYVLKGYITISKAKMIGYKEATGIFETSIGKFVIDLHHWTFYRYVSDEEYKKKCKEKYDETCLDAILKRLVNETFTW